MINANVLGTFHVESKSCSGGVGSFEVSTKFRMNVPSESTIDAVKCGSGYPWLVEHVTAKCSSCNGTLIGPSARNKP